MKASAPIPLRRALSALFFLASGLLRAVIPGGLDDPAFLLDPADPDAEWTELFANLTPKEALRANFREQRENDFRRGTRDFRGILRVWPEHGASLQYTEPSEVVLVATPGVLWRRPAGGEWTAYPASSASEMAAWSEALWRLDLATLSNAYAIHGRKDAGKWELLLTPKTDHRLPRLYLQGNDKALLSLEIDYGPRRRTLFTLEEVDRSPSMVDWSDYFPGKQ